MERDRKAMKRVGAQLKSKKGFSLVEVIVVLVIISILTAITLPALTGYIEEANSKAVVAEARNVYAALQTTSSLQVADGNLRFFNGNTLTDAGKTKITTLMGVAPAGTVTAVQRNEHGSITAFTYEKQADGLRVSYSNSRFTIGEIR